MSTPSSRHALAPTSTSVPRVRTRKILFASAHSIVDFSNGASVATLDVLQGLAAFGFESHAFCTPKLDLPQEVGFEQIIAELHEPYHVRTLRVRLRIVPRCFYLRRRDVPITVVRWIRPGTSGQRTEEIVAVLEFFRTYLEVLQPDVMLTYGGDPITMA